MKGKKATQLNNTHADENQGPGGWKGFVLKHRNKGYAVIGVTGAMLATSPAMAAGGTDFTDFQTKITDLAHGPFGIAISVLALILGVLMGLAKTSAWPAMVGFAVAAMFAVGPYMIGVIFSMFSTL